VLVDGGHPVAGLDHEDDRIVRDIDFVSTVGIGDDNVAAVGDSHARESWLSFIPFPVAVLVMEHVARSVLVVPFARRGVAGGPGRMSQGRNSGG
jgi:hypothetical protein